MPLKNIQLLRLLYRIFLLPCVTLHHFNQTDFVLHYAVLYPVIAALLPRWSLYFSSFVSTDRISYSFLPPFFLDHRSNNSNWPQNPGSLLIRQAYLPLRRRHALKCILPACNKYSAIVTLYPYLPSISFTVSVTPITHTSTRIPSLDTVKCSTAIVRISHGAWYQPYRISRSSPFIRSDI